MSSEFKIPSELTDNELEQLYSIHRKVYCEKGIGLDFNVWKSNLLYKDYHGISTKYVQMFHLHEDSIVDSYNIITNPIKIGNEYWSKIIEGGSAPLCHRDTKRSFLLMYSDLLRTKRGVFFIGETGVKYPAVTKLLIESGFRTSYCLDQIYRAISRLIQSSEFTLITGETGVEIKRQTIYTNMYHGYILVKNNTLN